MTEQQDPFPDRVVERRASRSSTARLRRLALLCQVRILDPGIIERVLKKDASVCGTSNPLAFAKLHDMLMFHLAIREKSVEAVGQARTAQIEDYVVERAEESLRRFARESGRPRE